MDRRNIKEVYASIIIFYLLLKKKKKYKRASLNSLLNVRIEMFSCSVFIRKFQRAKSTCHTLFSRILKTR